MSLADSMQKLNDFDINDLDINNKLTPPCELARLETDSQRDGLISGTKCSEGTMGYAATVHGHPCAHNQHRGWTICS